jgi:hypothetical protein
VPTLVGAMPIVVVFTRLTGTFTFTCTSTFTSAGIGKIDERLGFPHVNVLANVPKLYKSARSKPESDSRDAQHHTPHRLHRSLVESPPPDYYDAPPMRALSKIVSCIAGIYILLVLSLFLSIADQPLGRLGYLPSVSSRSFATS